MNEDVLYLTEPTTSRSPLVARRIMRECSETSFFPTWSLHLQTQVKTTRKKWTGRQKKESKNLRNHSEERIYFQAPAVNIIRGDDDDGVDERHIWTYIWDNIGRDDSTSLCSFIVTQHPPPHHHQTLIVRFWRQNICGYNLQLCVFWESSIKTMNCSSSQRKVSKLNAWAQWDVSIRVNIKVHLFKRQKKTFQGRCSSYQK